MRAYVSLLSHEHCLYGLKSTTKMLIVLFSFFFFGGGGGLPFLLLLLECWVDDGVGGRVHNRKPSDFISVEVGISATFCKYHITHLPNHVYLFYHSFVCYFKSL